MMMQKNEQTVMIAAGVTVATAAAAAMGYAAVRHNQNTHRAKKMARKLAKGTENMVLDLDRVLSRCRR